MCALAFVAIMMLCQSDCLFFSINDYQFSAPTRRRLHTSGKTISSNAANLTQPQVSLTTEVPQPYSDGTRGSSTAPMPGASETSYLVLYFSCGSGSNVKMSQWPRCNNGILMSDGQHVTTKPRQGKCSCPEWPDSGSCHWRGAPPIVASGRRSMVNLCCAMYIIGTPGTLRTRLRKSRSQVATM